MCRPFKSTPSSRSRFGTLRAHVLGRRTSRNMAVAVNRPRAWAEGTSGLDQGKRRGAFRSSLEAERIDLGNEPPLSVDGENSRPGRSPPRVGAMVQRHHPYRPLRRGPHGRRRFRVARRRDQFRRPCRSAWKPRCAALSAASSIASPMRRARPIACRRPARPTPRGRSFAISTTSRGSGNREIVRVRPFVRVAGNLSLSVSELSANIPPFNPQKMLARIGARTRPPPKMRRRRARRRGVVRHPRPRQRPAAREDRGGGVDRRGARARARSRELGRQAGQSRR